LNRQSLLIPVAIDRQLLPKALPVGVMLAACDSEFAVILTAF
jgi:hypothetical protein